MKKYLHIPIALLLIAVGIWGCTLHRSRPLITCFPTDDWTAVSAVQMLPGEGEEIRLAITPEQLKEAVDDVSVRPRTDFSGWTCPTVFLHLAAEDTVLSVEIGEDGCVTIAALQDPEGTRTCWRAGDGALYESLLAYLQN